MPTAYILVNCTLGSEEKIITEIAKLPDVKEVRGTYGVHDVFVKVKLPVPVVSETGIGIIEISPWLFWQMAAKNILQRKKSKYIIIQKIN